MNIQILAIYILPRASKSQICSEVLVFSRVALDTASRAGWLSASLFDLHCGQRSLQTAIKLATKVATSDWTRLM